VQWARTARDELTNLWIQADSVRRQALVAASNSVDQRLRSDPHNEGESREESERVMFVHPLAVRFDIVETSSVVRVLRIWEMKRRS
jgi:hypothetical protein